MDVDYDIYAHYDANTGEVLGFYSPSVHDNMPTPVRKVTQDEHRELCRHGAERGFSVNGGLRVIETPRPVTEWQRRKQFEISGERNRRFELGPLLIVPGVGAVDSNAKSRRAIRDVVSNMPGPEIEWIMADNSVTLLTDAQMRTLLAEINTFEQSLAVAARRAKDEVDALTTEQEVRSYDVSARPNWPRGAQNPAARSGVRGVELPDSDDEVQAVRPVAAERAI